LKSVFGLNSFGTGEGVVASIYTGSDLIDGITNSIELKDYLDTLHGYSQGSARPPAETSRIVEILNPTSEVLVGQSPGSVEFAFSYYSTGNVGRACLYIYYDGTSGWLPTCVEAIPDFVGYQAFSKILIWLTTLSIGITSLFRVKALCLAILLLFLALLLVFIL